MLWAILVKLGPEVFVQAIKDPILLEWATHNIIEDKKEQQELIIAVFEALKPWLNAEFAYEERKHKQREEEKLSSIANGANKEDVITTNAIDAFLRRRGLKSNGGNEQQ